MARRGPFDRVLGSPDEGLVLPGFVNAHHHIGAPFRSGLVDLPLEPWLHRRYRGGGHSFTYLTPEDLYYQTFWAALELLRAGVTTVLDHHAGNAQAPQMGVPNAIEAYRTAGIRCCLCIRFEDRFSTVYSDEEAFLASLPPALRERVTHSRHAVDLEAQLALWGQVFRDFDGRDGRLRIFIGPYTVGTCTDTLFRRVAAIAREHGTGIQTHLLESRYERIHGLKAWGKSPVAHLHEIGFLGPDVSCAHSVWLSDEDIRLMADTGTAAVHNPSANLRLSSGIARLPDMLRGGMRVAFGLDSFGLNDDNDYLSDLRLGMLLHRLPGVTRAKPSALEMLQVAIRGGADVTWGLKELGSLEPGKLADLILLDTERMRRSPAVSDAHPIEEVLLHRGQGRDVKTVLVDGRIVLEDGRFPGLDEDTVKAGAARSVEKMARFFLEDQELVAAVEPYLLRFLEGWDGEPAGSLPIGSQYNTR
jgi:5-methylthioadenosine/S-adenosylhomocysteine deaminase